MNSICNNCDCLNESCKGTNESVWTGCIYKTTNKTMSKQAMLENVLDLFLTSKQITQIENGWNAFYQDPLFYKNSIVIDMVKLSLSTKQEVKTNGTI